MNCIWHVMESKITAEAKLHIQKHSTGQGTNTSLGNFVPLVAEFESTNVDHQGFFHIFKVVVKRSDEMPRYVIVNLPFVRLWDFVASRHPHWGDGRMVTNLIRRSQMKTIAGMPSAWPIQTTWVMSVLNGKIRKIFNHTLKDVISSINCVKIG